jgi:xylose dehydrogenase (NAD/NADP)
MNIKTKLRWGILGAARINERLLPAIVEASNARLVAIASRRPGAAAQTLAQYAPHHQQNVQTYDNLEALLNDPDVEAVYLPLANREHAEWALRAIECGKHVLCEKPMALTVADIEAIKTAASKQKVTAMEGFMYRFHPQHARVLELIRLGTIGEVRSVRASYSFMMKPARLYRLIESVESGADITTSGIIDFGAGKYAHFDFSFERARRCEYEIIGTKGGIKCHTVWQLPGDVPVISWWTEDGRQCEERLPADNHFRLEIEHFSACVLNGNEPLLSLDDAKANCQIIVAALQSAAQGRMVKLAE